MLDHCRIGSLEKKQLLDISSKIDHCRIGSLEIPLVATARKFKDHCRIGSLESQNNPVPPR